MRGRLIGGNSHAPDPWVTLIVAVTKRAIKDAEGRGIYDVKREERPQIQEEARQWIDELHTLAGSQ